MCSEPLIVHVVSASDQHSRDYGVRDCAVSQGSTQVVSILLRQFVQQVGNAAPALDNRFCLYVVQQADWSYPSSTSVGSSGRVRTRGGTRTGTSSSSMST